MDTIYYLYNKTTGEYGGSGITPIEDDTWASTTVVPPAETPTPKSLVWADGAWSWV